MAKVIRIAHNGNGTGGTGWQGQVEFYANLPITLGTPAIGDVYLVEKPTTILLGAFTTKQSGLYIRDFNTGALSDWRKLNVKVKFLDSEFAVVSVGDESKQAKLDISGLSAATTRTMTVQDASGTIAYLADIPAGAGNNIYNIDGSLTGPRTVDLNGFNLAFDTGGVNEVRIDPDAGGPPHSIMLFKKALATGDAVIQVTGSGPTATDLRILSSKDFYIQSIQYPNTDGGINEVMKTNGSGVISFATVVSLIANNTITNALLSTVPTATIKGRITAGTGDVENLTVAQVKTLLGAGAVNGLATLDGNGFLPTAQLPLLKRAQVKQDSANWVGNGQRCRVGASWIDFAVEDFDTDSIHDNTVYESGTATGTQSATTLQDTSKAWTVNEWAGYTVKITGGTNADEVVKILSNTADTLTVDTAWITTVVSGSSTYEIILRGRFVVPETGLYLVSPRLTYSASLGRILGAFIYKNNTFFNSTFGVGISVESTVSFPPEYMQLNAGDYIEIKGYQGGAGEHPLLAFGNRVRCTIIKIGN